MVGLSGLKDLEEFWEDILSRDSERVKSIFSSLTKAEQKNVLAHLKRMLEEEGWHAEQRISAQFAFDTLNAA